MNKNCLNLKSLSDVASASGFAPDRLFGIIADPSKQYTHFRIPKRSGGFRDIRPPIGDLKTIQSNLKRFIHERTRWSRAIHGGVPGRSILTNARPHVGKEMVANLDISSFFPSTTPDHICEALVRCGCSAKAAEIIAALTTLDGGLPQGSPVSMILGNLVLEPLDSKFMTLQHRHGLDYSRYVDDLTISGGKHLKDFQSAFLAIIEKAGYNVSEEKMFFRGRNQPQLVTGLLVNDVIRPTSEFVQELRWMLRQCWPENEGPQRVAEAEGMAVRVLRRKLWGRILFVRQTKPKLGQRLRALMVKIAWDAMTEPKDISAVLV